MTIDDLDKRIKDRQQYAMDTQPLILEENEKLTESIQTAPKGQEARRSAVYDGASYPVLVQELTDALVSESNDAVRLTRELAAAKARIAELEARVADERRICREQEQRIRELERMVYDNGVAADAANARADAAEAEIPKAEAYIRDLNEKYAALESSHDRVALALRRAEDRADAAEREVNRLYRERVLPAEDERDQLAARVKELEFLIALDRTDAKANK
jgi:chromosome segregation ATPase